MKYKLPTLYKGKEWFIEYAVQHPVTGEWHTFKKRKGLNNKSLTNKQRAENAKDAIASLTELLKQGLLNPWAEEINELPPKVITVAEAFEQALAIRKPDLKHKTYLDCRNSQLHFMDACRMLAYDKLDIRQFNKSKVLQVLDLVREKRGISAQRWNIHKQRISPLFTVMVNREMIDVNPILGVPRKKVAKGKTFEPPTDEEQAIIDRHLYNYHRPMFTYKSLIYATGVRPDELLQVKRPQVDLKKGFIIIYPEGTKVGTDGKTLPLGEDLILLLTEHLQDCKDEDYIFSTWLKPGKTRIHRNKASDIWRKLVIDKKTGLGINRKLYSQKHRGTDDKILAGIPLEYLQEMYGHSSERMTKKYASQLQSKAMEEIKKKSPGIIPK